MNMNSHDSVGIFLFTPLCISQCVLNVQMNFKILLNISSNEWIFHDSYGKVLRNWDFLCVDI